MINVQLEIIDEDKSRRGRRHRICGTPCLNSTVLGFMLSQDIFHSKPEEIMIIISQWRLCAYTCSDACPNDMEVFILVAMSCSYHLSQSSMGCFMIFQAKLDELMSSDVTREVCALLL